jgi:hypothetical protein
MKYANKMKSTPISVDIVQWRCVVVRGEATGSRITDIVLNARGSLQSLDGKNATTNKIKEMIFGVNREKLTQKFALSQCVMNLVKADNPPTSDDGRVDIAT